MRESAWDWIAVKTVTTNQGATFTRRGFFGTHNSLPCQILVADIGKDAVLNTIDTQRIGSFGHDVADKRVA